MCCQADMHRGLRTLKPAVPIFGWVNSDLTTNKEKVQSTCLSNGDCIFKGTVTWPQQHLNVYEKGAAIVLEKLASPLRIQPEINPLV